MSPSPSPLRLRVTLPVLALTGCLTLSVLAEPTDLLYRGSGDDRFSGALATEDGGILAWGSTETWGSGGQDAWLVKTDPTGETEWQTALGRVYHEEIVEVVESPLGGFLVRLESWGDPWVARLDEGGRFLWGREFRDILDLEGCVALSDGRIVVAGSVPNGRLIPGTLDPGIAAWFAVLDDSGSELEHRAFEVNDGWTFASGLVADPTGGFFFVGSGFLLSFDASLQQRWGRSLVILSTPVATADGGVMLTAWITDGAGVRSLRWSRLDAAGAEILTKALGPDNCPRSASSGLELADGGMLLVATDEVGCSGQDRSVTRLDAAGYPLWSLTGGSPSAVLPSGEIVIAGSLSFEGGRAARLSIVGSDGQLPDAACTELRSVAPVYQLSPGDGVPAELMQLLPNDNQGTLSEGILISTPSEATPEQDCHDNLPREPSAVALDPLVEPLQVFQPIPGALALTWEETGADSYQVYRSSILATAGATPQFDAVTCGLVDPLALYGLAAGSWSYRVSASVRDSFGHRLESSLGRNSLGDEHDGRTACP